MTVESETRRTTPPEVHKDSELVSIRKPYFGHQDDHLNLLSKILKVAQHKLGIKPHYPKTGILSERPYYKVSRPTKAEDSTQA